MSIQNRAEATEKNIEGKAREAFGEITDDPKEKAKGQAQQVESETIHAAENLKDEIEDKKVEIKEKSKN